METRIEHENKRTGIRTIVNWYPDTDHSVKASYYRKDGSFIKTEVLGYAINEEAFMRLADQCTLS